MACSSPAWCSHGLALKFFWRGKRDLVARRVVVQPFCLGGFSVVDFQCKVLALHVQWVRRFVSSPSSWVSFMVFWFSSVLAAPRMLFFLHRMITLLIFSLLSIVLCCWLGGHVRDLSRSPP